MTTPATDNGSIFDRLLDLFPHRRRRKARGCAQAYCDIAPGQGVVSGPASVDLLSDGRVLFASGGVMFVCRLISRSRAEVQAYSEHMIVEKVSRREGCHGRSRPCDAPGPVLSIGQGTSRRDYMGADL